MNQDDIKYVVDVETTGLDFRREKIIEVAVVKLVNGEITDKILRSANGHEKEYVVEVNKPIDDDFITQMSNGIYLCELDRTTDKCFVSKESDYKFRIVLKQGMNRQIRRMCENIGYNVKSLKRVRIMNILLGDLKVGQYRNITSQEYKELQSMLDK